MVCQLVQNFLHQYITIVALGISKPCNQVLFGDPKLRVDHVNTCKHYICRLLLVLPKFDCSCPPSACIYSMRHHVNPAYPLMKLLWQATLWKARSNLRGHQIGFWSEFATWLETLNQSDHSNNRHKPVVTERARDRLVPACHFIISVVWYTQITLELDSRQDTGTYRDTTRTC